MAQEVELILRSQSGGVYDLITFDPRGTGNKIQFNCSRSVLELYDLASGFTLSNASDTAVGQNWAQAGKLANQCFSVEREIGEYGLLRYWGKSVPPAHHSALLISS